MNYYENSIENNFLFVITFQPGLHGLPVGLSRSGP